MADYFDRAAGYSSQFYNWPYRSTPITSKELDEVLGFLRHVNEYSFNRYTPLKFKMSLRVRYFLAKFGIVQYLPRQDEYEKPGVHPYVTEYSDTKLQRWWNWMPTEGLWRVVAPMIGECVGQSITHNAAWIAYGIYPVGHEDHRSESMQAIHYILEQLRRDGYINWLSAGDVWEIRPHKSLLSAEKVNA